jgi:lipopolysaccharide biosynthesis glycosyltransferase/Flp pilus assembly protein TadD
MLQTGSVVADLLSLGRSSRRQGDHQAALGYFTEAAQAAPRDLNAAVEVATTLGHLKRHDEAESHFRALLARAPKSAVAMAGLGELLARRGEPAAALTWFERAAAIEPRNVTRDLQVGRVLQTLNRLDEADARLRQAIEREPGHAAALTQLGEIARRRGDLAAAADFFTRSLAQEPTRIGTQLLMAVTWRDLGRLDAAESCYLTVLDVQPNHTGSLIGLGEIARARGDLALALERLREAAVSSPPTLPLRIMMADLLRDLDRSEEAEAAYQEVLRVSPDHPRAVAGLGILLIRRNDTALALQMFSDAAAKTPDNPEMWFRVAECLVRLARFEDVGDVLAKLEALPNVDRTELQLRRFNLLCATMKLDQAEAFLDVWGGAAGVPDGAVVRAMQLLAAQKRWPEVIAFFRARVIGKRWTGSPEFLMEPLARAARHTGRYAECRELLGLLPNAATASVRETQDQLLEEMWLRRHVAPVPPDGTSACGTSIGDPLRSQRAALIARVLQHDDTELHVFFCADAAYLAGTTVSLYSLLKNNEGPCRSLRFSVFCTDDVLDLATEVFRALAASFAVCIDVRAASALVASDTGLRVGWGNFTPGRALSQAAYYRIYAARQLINEDAGARALYIDSDTCVFSGIGTLQTFDLAGQPLAARVDDSSKVSIQRAVRLLGLDRDIYFNSGVLLFDLQHCDLPDLLDRSLEISLKQQDLLTHVDQCALNVAFQGRFTELPDRFNWFVSPDTDTDANAPQPVISHFIAHPKPWDTMYPPANCMPWVTAFAGLGDIVRPRLLKRLLALHFPAMQAGA